MKNLISSLLIILLTLTLSACANEESTQIEQNTSLEAFSDPLENHRNDATQFAEIFPVSENNPFIFASFDEVVALLESGTGVLAFGFPECPHCHNAFPILEQAFVEMDISSYEGFLGRILYYNPREDREENNERYQILISYLSEYLIEDEYGNPRLYVPDVYFISSGRITGNHSGTVPDMLNSTDPFYEQQVAELKDIYMSLIVGMFLYENQMGNCCP